MTYDDVVKKNYAHVGFVYSDRVIIIKTTSVTKDDFEDKTFSHFAAGKVPFFKASTTVYPK